MKNVYKVFYECVLFAGGFFKCGNEVKKVRGAILQLCSEVCV